MDTFSQIESSRRRRWHIVTGAIICTMGYVLALLLVSTYWFD